MKSLCFESTFTRSLPSTAPSPRSSLKCCLRNVCCVLSIISISVIDLATAQSGLEDSTPNTSSPPIESQQLEAQQHRGQHIQEQRAADRIGPLEAEFLALLNDRSSDQDPHARMEAIRAWQAEKGAALKAEKESRRAQQEPQSNTVRAEALARRQEQLTRKVAPGRLGPLEVEFRILTQDPELSPEERREAMQIWLTQNGDALKAERAGRRSQRQAQLETQRTEARNRRLRHIAEEAAAGRIGPLEAELQTLLAQDHPTPQARAEAIRAWLTTDKGADLQAEREAGRQTEVSKN